MICTTRQPRGGNSFRTATLLTLASALVACGDTGGGDDGGGVPPSTLGLSVDFGLRRDFQLDGGFLSDALTRDVNLDGFVDIVEASFAKHSLGIAFGNADGTFTSVYKLPTIGAPWRLVAADLTGNGLEDLAVVCLDEGGLVQAGVQVFLQGPNAGDFGASASLVLAGEPIDLAAASYSGAVGTIEPSELFVASRRDMAILRLRMDGSGNLVECGRLDADALGPLGHPISLATLDIGGDGLLDLAVGEIDLVNGAPDRVIAYPRGADGFGDPVLVMQPVSDPIVDEAGDVDGNGYPDLSVAQLSGSRAFLLAGDAGGLSDAIAIEFEGTTSSLVFGDFDGDGLRDVAGTVLDRSTVNVQLSTGPLTWGEPVRYNVGNLPRALGLVFLPGDPIPDLVCANGDDVSVLLGVGQGFFRGAVGYPTLSEGPIAIETGDLDGDGDQDAVVLTAGHTSVVFLDGDGRGGFEASSVVPLVPSSENYGELAIADMNGDGLLDVVTTVLQSNELRVYRNRGAGMNFQPAAPTDIYPLGQKPIGLDVADFDENGIPDVVVGNAGDHSAQVLLGTGSGALNPRPAVPLPSRPGAILSMDVDNDGHIDVVMSAGGAGTPNSVIVLAGDGHGGLSVASSFEVDALTASLDAGDLDGDGLVDFVVGQPGFTLTEIFILHNRGGFAFEARRLDVGSDPGVVLTGDVDEDGATDIIIGSATGDMRIAYGDGTGAFPTIDGGKGRMPLPFNTLAGAFTDVDGDGLRDLLFVSPSSSLVWVALNLSTEAVDG